MEKKIVHQKFEEDYLKSYNERDMLVRKYEDQA